MIFYFPSLPGPHRDNLIIKLLKHYPNSIMLIEKPTHATCKEALLLEQKLKDENMFNRLLYGQHDALDPSRKEILSLASHYKSQIKEISIKINHPKSQYLPKDARIFEKK